MFQQTKAWDDPKEFNEAINNNLQRAQAIINEMNQSLNMAEGGEFASRMRGLYDYFDRRLHESNMRKEEAGILEIIKHITVLRDAWAELLQRGGPAAAEALRPGSEQAFARGDAPHPPAHQLRP